MRRIPGLTPLLLLLLAATAGCYRAKPATVPLRTVAFETGTPYAKCLVVFLPGRGDGPEELARHGFPAALKKAGSQCSMIGVDSHLGYFANRTLVARLHEDVIAPARARNEDVWLVGISLGGLGGLLYTREHPGDVWGVITLAPYLGEDEVIGEVTRAGGLAQWSPQTPPGDADFRRLWLFLKGYGKPDPALPPLWLGYGRGDRLAGADGLLAKVLPADHVLLADGGHRWSTWTKLWDQFLAGETVPGRRIAGVTPR
jgi:pimeloyl-ACP methyl ester carboxylesterase